MIGRDAFLYMAPRGREVEDWAQCSACYSYTGRSERCAYLGDKVVTSGMSCGLFNYGEPHKQPVRAVYSPEEVGLVDRQVRCENCQHSDGGQCGLYEKLNLAFPTIFSLETAIEPRACCNAQTPQVRTDARLDAAVSLLERMTGRKDAVDYPVKLELELSATDFVPYLVKFLRYVQAAASAGHSFSIEADREEGAMPEFLERFGLKGPYPRVGIDGDGADKIGRIMLNGTEIK